MISKMKKAMRNHIRSHDEMEDNAACENPCKIIPINTRVYAALDHDSEIEYGDFLCDTSDPLPVPNVDPCQNIYNSYIRNIQRQGRINRVIRTGERDHAKVFRTWDGRIVYTSEEHSTPLVINDIMSHNKSMIEKKTHGPMVESFIRSMKRDRSW